jgi:alcohol oxidase
MEVYRGEVISGNPPFPKGPNAAFVEVDGPLGDLRDIQYTAEEDAIIDKWVRENVSSPWYSLGTCKMASLERDGVDGLKLADLSIVPRNIAANTNNTALVIGEKAADIFIQELGLGKK